MPCERLMTLEDAASYCGMPTRNFRKHIGVPPVKLGPRELWDKVKLDAYIEALQGGGKGGPVGGGPRDWSSAVTKFKTP